MASRAEALKERSAWLAIVTLLMTHGCQPESNPPTTGSETHFLTWCGSQGGCDEGLDCVCGVCTATCSEDAQSCGELSASAECVDLSSTVADPECPDIQEMACDVSCTADSDCASLSEEHRCDRGVCRRLASDCTSGDVTGNEVALIGDQFISDTHRLTSELEALARDTGALADNDGYRDYSSSLITPFGGPADLSTQYALAVADGTPQIVIMDVGGPNALVSCPDPLTSDCPTLQEAVSGAEALWEQMATDGVEAVVDFFYPDPVDETLKAKFDVLRPLLQAACEASPVECHFVDLRPTFEGHADEYLQPAGILPTEPGSAATAGAIFSVMQQNCIAQ